MSFYVISKRALIREMTGAFCEHEGFQVLGLFDHLADIPDGGGEPNVVLHLSYSDDIDTIGIDPFRARFKSSRIILLASSAVSPDLIQQMSSRVEATILDDKSLPTLLSFLTLVQEGFCISPSTTTIGWSERIVGDHGRSSLPTALAPEPLPLAAEIAGRERGRGGAEAATRGCAEKLSARELAVIQKLRDGASNKDIAKDLNIVESTVKVHLRGCFRKIGVHNRTQAAVWAAKHLSH